MSMFSNEKGQGLMIGMLLFVMAILVLVAVTPALNTALNIGKQSDFLNCAGYDYDNSGTVGDNQYDYNSSISTNKIACTASDLGIPFIWLTVIIGGISAIVMGKSQSQPEATQY